MSLSWKLEKVENMLAYELYVADHSPLYYSMINFDKYGLNQEQVKEIVKKYAVHMWGNTYQYNKVWISVENDRIKIEKKYEAKI